MKPIEGLWNLIRLSAWTLLYISLIWYEIHNTVEKVWAIYRVWNKDVYDMVGIIGNHEEVEFGRMCS